MLIGPVASAVDDGDRRRRGGGVGIAPEYLSGAV